MSVEADNLTDIQESFMKMPEGTGLLEYLYAAGLTKSDFAGMDFSRQAAREFGLFHVDLCRANLSRADFREADLSEVDLSEANLVGAILIRANLRGANLIGANLNGANLTGADLSGANLSRASLVGARLKGANLLGTRLKEITLDGTVLKNLDLPESADLSGAKIERSKADLPRRLANARLRKYGKVKSRIARVKRVDAKPKDVGIEGLSKEDFSE